MQIFIKAGEDVQQNKVNLMFKHISKFLAKHETIKMLKLSLKSIKENGDRNRIRTVIKIQGYTIVCIESGKDIYSTLANLVEKLDRTLLSFYVDHNHSMDNQNQTIAA